MCCHQALCLGLILFHCSTQKHINTLLYKTRNKSSSFRANPSISSPFILCLVQPVYIFKFRYHKNDFLDMISMSLTHFTQVSKIGLLFQPSCDMSSKRHLVKTVRLKRVDARESWGFQVVGGWMEGEWISQFILFFISLRHDVVSSTWHFINFQFYQRILFLPSWTKLSITIALYREISLNNS